ncbi:MAG: serine hydrolase domain-containing protein, partial [Steroidobacteraceae bacterium]
MLRDWGAPGAAVSVVKDGQIVFSKGYGVLELGRPQRVDQNTLFGIGSMSKTFTATIVARLVEQGRLGWDDRIIDHLPTFRLADPWVTAHVTIRDVLTHRVGLDEAGNNAIWAFQSVDREQYVSRLRHVPLTGRFRDTFTYSNGLLTMTGELLEAVAGKSWEELIAAEVFAPLGMTRSVSGRDKLVAPGHWVPNWFGRPPEGALKGQAGLRPGVTNVAAPHGLDRHGRRILYYWHYKPESAPAGAVTSSAHDMGLYMLAYLGEGGFLEPATLHEMLGLQSRHEAPEEGSPQRRLGWGLG